MSKKKPKQPSAPPTPPPPSTRAEVERMFRSYLASVVEHQEETCKEWQARIAKATEPARLIYDLDWSLTLFESAAKLAVYTDALKALTDPKSKATMDTLVEYATQEALSKASYVSRSSSASSNLTNDCLRAAWSKLAEDLRSWGKSLKVADEFYGALEIARFLEPPPGGPPSDAEKAEILAAVNGDSCE